MCSPYSVCLSVSRLVERAASAARTTFLVGDEVGSGCAALARELLQRQEGLTPFEATLRVAQSCPAAANVAAMESV